VGIPLVTIIGLQFGRLLAGTVVIEVRLRLARVGWLTVKAVRTLDYPVARPRGGAGAGIRPRSTSHGPPHWLPSSAHPVSLSALAGRPAPSGARSRLRRHWPGWIGVGIVATAGGLCRLSRPYLAPHDPYSQDIATRLRPPAWAPMGSPEHLLAPTTSAGTT